MGKESLILAKTAALKKNFDAIQYGFRGRCLGQAVEPLFPRYFSIIKELKEINPELYNDIPELEIPTSMGQSSSGALYELFKIEPLVQNLDYILELSANVRIGNNVEQSEKKKRVFISHGRSNEWTKVQNYLERDLGIPTLELAQEPNLGRTVLQKLDEESLKCSVAVIVMTGEDMTDGGEIRARENVMHEIGYFQGKYGLMNVVLLHEQGVNIPSNIHGLVYIGFPKDTSEVSLGALTREMKYSINDFQIGDSVYHLSNTDLIMIIIKINNNPDEVSCSWVDKAGTRHVEEFLPQELGKRSDLGLEIYVM